ncbi:MAG TPA: ABC transporter permease [Xanthomonadales bacterium]|nr:ABC transporter permease [Xanthomonadales bacterium]
MNALRRLLAIVTKELYQLRRDRLTFAMIVGIPTVQLLLFGYAINMDVRNLHAVVVDQAQTQRSRGIVAALAHAQVVEVRYRDATPQAAMDRIRRGDASVAVVLPPDLERRLQRRDRPAMQLVVDGSDPVIVQAARQLAALPIHGDAPPPAVEVLALYNPERRSALNTVPGLIGVILTMTMVMFTAVAIVRERERGNMEFLIATPVRPVELVVGKVLPFVAIGLVQVTIVLALGSFIFHVPVRGGLVEVYAVALAYIVACLGLGVFISTLARTQFQAMQVAFFTFLPQILLSGFMFPYAGMPRAAQWLAEVLPLTHFVRMIRAVMLRATPLHELYPDLLALVAFSLVAIGIAVLRFRKRLD